MSKFSTFELPPGYIGWCNECGNPPYNKVTRVWMYEDARLSPKQVVKDIPGVGFKTEQERIEHRNKFHDYRKG